MTPYCLRSQARQAFARNRRTARPISGRMQNNESTKHWPSALHEYVIDEHTLRLTPTSSGCKYHTHTQIRVTAVLAAISIGLLLVTHWYWFVAFPTLSMAALAYVFWNPNALLRLDAVEIRRHHHAWKFTLTHQRSTEVYELLDSRIEGAAVVNDLNGGAGGNGNGSHVLIALSYVGEPFSILNPRLRKAWTVGAGLSLEYSKLAALRDLFHPAGLPPMLKYRFV